MPDKYVLMGNQFKEIPLHRLNIPTETLRQSSTRAGDESLKLSLSQHGVLSPLVVTELGTKKVKDKTVTEYAVWDGTRRTRALRELNQPTTMKVPCLIVTGDDKESLVAQVNINNTRERLSEFAEAEALRQLVQDHGMKQVEAAGVLLKSKTWASEVMRVWKLPSDILLKVREGQIPVSHAKVIAGYMEKPDIQEMLVAQSLSGETSHPRLKALAVRAEQLGVKQALKTRPRNLSVGAKSTLRVEPLQKSIRLELQLDDSDTIDDAVEKITDLISTLRKSTHEPLQ